MFYTKYRPQKFSEISKPNEAAEALVSQVLKGKLVHAYLFVGSRGTGKTTTARILAKALNCEHLDKNGDPCDKCDVCKAIKKGNFMDLIEIDAASNRGIDDIRELKNKIKLAPGVGKNKVYIIDEVHMLTNEAFNALLKTLEEPPAHTNFILCTTEFNKVPETIKSRCQVFRFRRASLQQIVKKLKFIADSEKIKISDEDLNKIAKASLGGFRDAETLLQQVSEGEMSIDTLLNIGSKQAFVDFAGFLISGDRVGALNQVSKLFEDGVDIYVWMGELIRYLRELLFLKSGTDAPGFDVTPDLEKEIDAQLQEIDLSWLVESLYILVKNQSNVKTSYVPTLPLEVSLVQICGMDGVGDQTGGENDPSDPDSPVRKNTNIKSKVKKDSEKKGSGEELLDILKEQAESLGEKDENAKTSKRKDEIVVIPIETVKEKWNRVLENMSKLNSSLVALLKSGNPIEVDGKFLVLEVYYAFHKERLESPKNRTLIEGSLKDVFELEMKIKCRLCAEKPNKLKKNETGLLTDYNIVPAKSDIKYDKAAVIDMLDGGLPAL